MREAMNLYKMLKTNPLTAPFLTMAVRALAVVTTVAFAWGIVIGFVLDRVF